MVGVQDWIFWPMVGTLAGALLTIALVVGALFALRRARQR